MNPQMRGGVGMFSSECPPPPYDVHNLGSGGVQHAVQMQYPAQQLPYQQLVQQNQQQQPYLLYPPACPPATPGTLYTQGNAPVQTHGNARYSYQDEFMKTANIYGLGQSSALLKSSGLIPPQTQTFRKPDSTPQHYMLQQSSQMPIKQVHQQLSGTNNTNNISYSEPTSVQNIHPQQSILKQHLSLNASQNAQIVSHSFPHPSDRRPSVSPAQNVPLSPNQSFSSQCRFSPLPVNSRGPRYSPVSPHSGSSPARPNSAGMQMQSVYLQDGRTIHQYSSNPCQSTDNANMMPMNLVSKSSVRQISSTDTVIAPSSCALQNVSQQNVESTQVNRNFDFANSSSNLSATTPEQYRQAPPNTQFGVPYSMLTVQERLSGAESSSTTAHDLAGFPIHGRGRARGARGIRGTRGTRGARGTSQAKRVTQPRGRGRGRGRGKRGQNVSYPLQWCESSSSGPMPTFQSDIEAMQAGAVRDMVESIKRTEKERSASSSIAGNTNSSSGNVPRTGTSSVNSASRQNVIIASTLATMLNSAASVSTAPKTTARVEALEAIRVKQEMVENLAQVKKKQSTLKTSNNEAQPQQSSDFISTGTPHQSQVKSLSIRPTGNRTDVPEVAQSCSKSKNLEVPRQEPVCREVLEHFLTQIPVQPVMKCVPNSSKPDQVHADACLSSAHPVTNSLIRQSSSSSQVKETKKSCPKVKTENMNNELFSTMSTTAVSQLPPTISTTTVSRLLPTISITAVSQLPPAISTTTVSQPLPTVSTTTVLQPLPTVATTTVSQLPPTIPTTTVSQPLLTMSITTLSQLLPTISKTTVSQLLPTTSITAASRLLPTIPSISISQEVSTLSNTSLSQQLSAISTKASNKPVYENSHTNAKNKSQEHPQSVIPRRTQEFVSLENKRPMTAKEKVVSMWRNGQVVGRTPTALKRLRGDDSFHAPLSGQSHLRNLTSQTLASPPATESRPEILGIKEKKQNQKQKFDSLNKKHSMSYIMFHGHKLICLKHSKESVLLLCQFQFECFPDKGMGSINNCIDRSLRIKKKTLQHPSKHEIVSFLKKNDYKTEDEVLTINVEDARRVYHHMYGIKNCVSASCIVEQRDQAVDLSLVVPRSKKRTLPREILVRVKKEKKIHEEVSGSHTHSKTTKQQPSIPQIDNVNQEQDSGGNEDNRSDHTVAYGETSPGQDDDIIITAVEENPYMIRFVGPGSKVGGLCKTLVGDVRSYLHENEYYLVVEDLRKCVGSSHFNTIVDSDNVAIYSCCPVIGDFLNTMSPLFPPLSSYIDCLVKENDIGVQESDSSELVDHQISSLKGAGPGLKQETPDEPPTNQANKSKNNSFTQNLGTVSVNEHDPLSEPNLTIDLGESTQAHISNENNSQVERPATTSKSSQIPGVVCSSSGLNTNAQEGTCKATGSSQSTHHVPVLETTSNSSADVVRPTFPSPPSQYSHCSGETHESASAMSLENNDNASLSLSSKRMIPKSTTTRDLPASLASLVLKGSKNAGLKQSKDDIEVGSSSRSDPIGPVCDLNKSKAFLVNAYSQVRQHNKALITALHQLRSDNVANRRDNAELKEKLVCSEQKLAKAEREIKLLEDVLAKVTSTYKSGSSSSPIEVDEDLS